MINVGGFEYKSKVDLVTDIYKRLSSFNKNDPFWFDLFKRHPNYKAKLGCGIREINLLPNPITKQMNHLELIRFDGTRDHISWVKCAHQRLPGERANLLEAMRSAIVPQLLDFKMRSAEYCALCASQENLEVDHIYKFKDMTNDFFSNYEQADIPTKFNEDSFCRVIFRPEDYIFSVAWIEFHEAKKRLRMLCKKCNSKEK